MHKRVHINALYTGTYFIVHFNFLTGKSFENCASSIPFTSNLQANNGEKLRKLLISVGGFPWQQNNSETFLSVVQFHIAEKSREAKSKG